MEPVVTTRVEQRIAIVTLDNAPVNALSSSVRDQLYTAFAALDVDAAVDAMVLIGAGRGFCAGADIREFGKTQSGLTLPQVIARIERTSKPVVAAVHGHALGGGLELALGAHYRIASTSAKLGVAEITLGLIPGAGGTQRLPRLVTMSDALRMISTGDVVTATQACAMGLIDAVTDDELLPAALNFTRQLLKAQRGVRPTREQPILHTDLTLLDKADAELQRKRPVLPAPLKVIEALRAAATLDFDAGMAVERAAFLELRASAESRAYRHAFFAEREAARVPGSLAAAVAHRVSAVAVVGAGTMGQGIALCCAAAGYTVQLSDANDSVLTRAFDSIKRSCDSRVKRGRLNQDSANQIIARIQPARSTAQLAHADLVVEAVFEDLDVKRQVLTALDAQVKPDAIIASNTSYLDIDQIAVATTRPQQVIGLHFFSPAHAMQLVEIVPGARTDANVIATALQFGRQLGKHAVLVGNCRGFVGNRMLARRVRESYFLLEEGATPAQIDQAFTDFGFPMGPFAVGDLSGLDIGWRNRQANLARLTTREQRCTILDQMVASGRLGQKTGSGFYKYDEQRRATPDPEVVALIEQHSREVGISRRVISSDEIIERCLLAMVDEAARILDEGIARCASDIDVVWLHGYGFPRHRGGPMHYADQYGLGEVRAAMLRYQAQQGSEYWSVAPLLEQLVQSGGTFAEWTPQVAEAHA